jgi:3-methylcrotonyl-CoA carboxylase alpha subunit
MFSKILIANRGEIACRVIRTARRMGVATVAVYSDADAKALHVEMADEAVHIGGSRVNESYLVGEKIVAAARETGAQAIHPGYGFLSENPDFVETVTAAGLAFIGPSAASIRAMGLKDAAKRLMEAAGVPVVPGYHGEAQEHVLLATKAREIGYPVLIKARAGGGGKGMRRVDNPEDFAEQLAGAKREAKAAFGDERVLVEKYVEKPRHIEVQVFGDNFGNVVHLFERDCSAQRRHQKVIEEAPAPGMTDEMRRAMTDAAVKAAQTIDYSGAGTIEFIVDASEGLRPDRFWFMEMNTRLQVEHPVTEMVTGVDLVEWQLRVAAGEKLPKSQEQLRLDGHAFEARLYSENPAKGFLPAVGTLHHLKFPEAGPALRVETGVRAGDQISPFYDPMIAKIVVKAGDRTQALAALDEALKATEVAGSTVNLAFLSELARDPDFASGDVDTGLIARHQPALTALPAPGPAVVAQALLLASGMPLSAPSDEPWESLAGYSHFGPLSHRVAIKYGKEEIRARVTALPNRTFEIAVEGQDTATKLNPKSLRRWARWPGQIAIFDGAATHSFKLEDPLLAAEHASGGVGSLAAPMPGLVKLVKAAAGASVRKGQPLLVLEAMKMEHTIAAPHDGMIAEIAAEGAQVAEGTVLVKYQDA